MFFAPFSEAEILDYVAQGPFIPVHTVVQRAERTAVVIFSIKYVMKIAYLVQETYRIENT